MDSVRIFGQTYPKVALHNPNQPLGVFLDQNQIFINHHSFSSLSTPYIKLSRSDKKLVDQKITNWLELLAQKYILQKTPLLAQKMNLAGKYRRICLKRASTRWGSCSSYKNLNFNYALIHHPPEIIDYVIIHELAHLQEMNHSAAFWRLVAQYDPLHKLHRKQLNRK
ncbi:M48 family metallopeptidase [Microgenomates group bacterium]|nr:M48 family metallopeptidase [Microgenomates group bacterium]